MGWKYLFRYKDKGDTTWQGECGSNWFFIIMLKGINKASKFDIIEADFRK